MLGTQVVGLVQDAVLGAAKPGLGMGTQVPQVVVIVDLHEVLEGLGDPAGEGSSQMKPQLLPALCPVHPVLPQPRIWTPSPCPPAQGPGRQPLLSTLAGTTASSLWS